jgi:hypothetical protein
MNTKLLPVILIFLFIPLLFVSKLVVWVLCWIAENIPDRNATVYYYQTSWEEYWTEPVLLS